MHWCDSDSTDNATLTEQFHLNASEANMKHNKLRRTDLLSLNHLVSFELACVATITGHRQCRIPTEWLVGSLSRSRLCHQFVSCRMSGS